MVICPVQDGKSFTIIIRPAQPRDTILYNTRVTESTR